MDRWTMARVFQFPAQENISVAVQRSSARSQRPRWGSVAAGGFCPAGGRWGRSTGDGEEGLSCPGDASVRLVPLLGVESNVSSEPSQVIAERAGESSV